MYTTLILVNCLGVLFNLGNATYHVCHTGVDWYTVFAIALSAFQAYQAVSLFRRPLNAQA